MTADLDLLRKLEATRDSSGLDQPVTDSGEASTRVAAVSAAGTQAATGTPDHGPGRGA